MSVFDLAKHVHPPIAEQAAGGKIGRPCQRRNLAASFREKKHAFLRENA